MEINEDGIYHFTCEQGHVTVNFMQEQLFEVLFDLGVMALLDGYTREAVASVASSIERFYEFCIRLLLHHNGVDEKEVDYVWKTIAGKNSERQLGAFYYLYLNTFKTAPPKFDEKRIEFRNSVIHKGAIPGYNQTYEYAEYVYEYLKSVIILLRTICNDFCFGYMVMRNQRKYFENNVVEIGYAGVKTIPTIISLTSAAEIFDNQTFEQGTYGVRCRMKSHYV